MPQHYRPGMIFALTLTLQEPRTSFDSFEAILKGPNGFELRARGNGAVVGQPNKCGIQGEVPKDAPPGFYPIVNLERRFASSAVHAETAKMAIPEGAGISVDSALPGPSMPPNEVLEIE